MPVRLNPICSDAALHCDVYWFRPLLQSGVDRYYVEWLSAFMGRTSNKAMSSTHPHFPSVDELLRDRTATELIDTFGRQAVTDKIRNEIADRRREEPHDGMDRADDILSAVGVRLASDARPTLRAVFNLTGTVIHTNLGRAPLADVAFDAIHAAASGPVNLEFDLDRGKRGHRDSHVNQLICELTGAEAATVVNNNAAAVLLVLSALARRKEVIVSRGELIEIGGSFRIPDIMKSAGCKLIEVGTTNRTHPNDFRVAIGTKSALVMKVHMANYKIDGFTAEVAEPDLAEIAHTHDLPFVVDLGSGTLVDFTGFGLPHEPTPQEALSNGADLVTFSGDKLLGGPQAGIICGRKDLIARLNKNPIKRALRLDKVTLATLAATLQLYRDPDRLSERLPVLRLLTRPYNDILEQAERLRPVFAEALNGIAAVNIEAVSSQVGSGSLPVDRLPSAAISVSPKTSKRGKGKALERLAARFRGLPQPMIGRLYDGKLIFDLRCLESHDEKTVAEQLRLLASSDTAHP
jgi:L-seryl-tRNA(Ser) seleniumtransferase